MTTRTVVVTGAAGGIGRVVAERLTDDGYHVVALDRQGSEIVRAFDVTDERQWRELATTLDAPVHGLVNCAGITRRARLGEVTVAEMTDAYAVNVLAPLLAIQALTPVMAAGSAIVNIGSLAALTGHYPVAYTTSKWALRGLTHTAALSLGENGIRVNIVHPGFIDTPTTESAPARFRDSSISETALARAGTAAEVAGAVAFLLGADSTYMTGAEITVDGGASSHGGVKSISDALRPELQEHR